MSRSGSGHRAGVPGTLPTVPSRCCRDPHGISEWRHDGHLRNNLRAGAGKGPPNATVSVVRSARAGGDTKSPKSRRRLRICHLVLDALATARALQSADKRAAGPLYNDDGLVFCTPDGHP